jgi:hypothetical protein
MRVMLAACCLLVVFCGCAASTPPPKNDETLAETIGDSVMFGAVMMIYREETGQWPSSVRDLKRFCSNSKNQCPDDVDWAAFDKISLRKLPDGGLRISSKRMGTDDKPTFSFILDGPDHKRQ